MRLFLILGFSFLATVDAFGQQSLQDSLANQQFKTYFSNLLRQPKDTVLFPAFPTTYKITYRTSCSFTEVIYPDSDHGAKVFKYASGGRFINDGIDDSHLFLCTQNPTIPVGAAAEVRVSMDSTTVMKDVVISYLNLSGYGLFNPDFKGQSFAEYQFLILERSFPTYIGNQTSYGQIETFFLERID